MNPQAAISIALGLIQAEKQRYAVEAHLAEQGATYPAAVAAVQRRARLDEAARALSELQPHPETIAAPGAAGSQQVPPAAPGGPVQPPQGEEDQETLNRLVILYLATKDELRSAKRFGGPHTRILVQQCTRLRRLIEKQLGIPQTQEN